MKKSSNIILIIILLTALAFSGYFGYLTVSDIMTHKIAANEYTDIKSEYTKETSSTTETPTDAFNSPLPYPAKKIDFAALKKTNENFIGWIYFPFIGNSKKYSFTLDYPVVYESKINKYLKTTFEGKHNNAGCIFMDQSSNASFFGYNDFIYGHHMRDDSMFGSLEKVHKMDDLAYLKKHPQYLYVYTPTACHKYIMIAYEQVNSSKDMAYGVATEDSLYDQIEKNIKSLKTYMQNDSIAWDTRPEILNLSTCDGPAGTNKRFILHFVKIMAYEYDS